MLYRYQPYIRRNLLESLHKMVQAMQTYDLALHTAEAEEAAIKFMDMEPLQEYFTEDCDIDAQLLEQTQVLWADPGIQEVYHKGKFKQALQEKTVRYSVKEWQKYNRVLLGIWWSRNTVIHAVTRQ